MTDTLLPMETLKLESIDRFDGFALVSIRHIPVRGGTIIDLLTELAEAHINVNQLVQLTDKQGTALILMVIYQDERQSVEEHTAAFCRKFEGASWSSRDCVCRITMRGSGIRTHSQHAAAIIELLEEAEIEMLMIGTSEMSLSLYVSEDQASRVMDMLQREFWQKSPLEEIAP